MHALLSVLSSFVETQKTKQKRNKRCTHIDSTPEEGRDQAALQHTNTHTHTHTHTQQHQQKKKKGKERAYFEHELYFTVFSFFSFFFFLYLARVSQTLRFEWLYRSLGHRTLFFFFFVSLFFFFFWCFPFGLFNYKLRYFISFFLRLFWFAFLHTERCMVRLSTPWSEATFPFRRKKKEKRKKKHKHTWPV